MTISEHDTNNSLAPNHHVSKASANHSPVAIIGAGMAGLVCAQELNHAGIKNVLFDKAQAPGGRMTTRRRDDFEWDMGAQMFTASRPEFMAQIREWQFHGLVRRWRGRFIGPGLEGAEDGPFYVGVPRMGQLARSMALGLDIRYPVQVAGFHQDAESQLWHLWDKSGQNLGEYRAVLCTTPQSQTEHFFRDYQEINNSLLMCGRMLPTWSVYVTLRHELDVPFDARTFVSGPIKSTYRNNRKPERSNETECWTINADPELSSRFIDYPKENVVDDMIAALEFSINKKLPPVLYSFAHKWACALAVGKSNFRSQYNNRNRLGFAGDWVQPPHNQFGGVEAAYLSGRTLAQQVKVLLS